MNLINTLGFIAISFLLVRVIILIKIDSQQKKNTLLKLLFGAYAFKAMIPLMRKSGSEEGPLVKVANICLVVFYVLFVTVLLIVWLRYHNPSKPVPNDNKTNQAMLA